MILEMLETGPLQVNTYILGDEAAREAAVFDPGGDVERILDRVDQHGLRVSLILNTHGHWDHTGGNGELQRATKAPILTHHSEEDGLAGAADRAAFHGFRAEPSNVSRFIREGDILSVGSIACRVLDLRGHSPGGLGFVFEGELTLDGRQEKRTLVICGDALFAGSIGRTDFPGGDMDLLLTNIRNKIFTLPEDTLVLPGHGPLTTVGREKRTNPFFS